MRLEEQGGTPGAMGREPGRGTRKALRRPARGRGIGWYSLSRLSSKECVGFELVPLSLHSSKHPLYHKQRGEEGVQPCNEIGE